MKIKSIRVKNFRCLKDVQMSCDDLTVLVGGNGVGKSCMLKALNFFYNTNIKVEEPDFYDGSISEPISVVVEYWDLTAYETKLFKPYLEGDVLSVEKVIQFNYSRPIQRYFGTRFKNSDFEDFRMATGTDMRKEYNKLLTKKAYQNFPKYQNKNLAEDTLQEWEMSNKKKCKRERDNGQFFGFQNVGMHRLEKFTKFIMIPAVQEAGEEGVENTGSIFEQIMDVVVKSTLAQNQKLVKLEEVTQRRYARIIDSSKNKELKGLEKDLTSNLSIFVPDSEVNIKWIEGRGVTLHVPRAYVTLREGGYHNTVDRCGHGLQRAYILSLFQQLAVIQASMSLESSEQEEKVEFGLPSLIIGIEEPELYQHPDRIRFFANTLLQLSEKGIDGTVDSIQILHSTHSPLLVDFRRVEQIRIFRKIIANGSRPKVTAVTTTDLSVIARFIEEAKGDKKNTIKPEALRQRLVQLMNPWMNEGFFANLIVLVEGIKDRALILGEALYRNVDLESKGVSVIPCVGKHNLPSAIAIFNCLGIPTYTIWDSDKDKKKDKNAKKANKEILRCLGCEAEDYPCRITNNFSCVGTNLEDTFRYEIGKSKFSTDIAHYCSQNNLGKPRYVMENPYAVADVIKYFREKGYVSKTLVDIVDKILEKT
ncbi:MAG: AAA family ATPase [Candidatus Bathyarchaeum tardum]|nr:MAG: AAA family ATPase [Candidatus Bathyarchaeum tardum]